MSDYDDTWAEDEDGGLMLDPYYDDSQYDDDALDWYDDDYEPDGIAWEDMPLGYRIRANVGYWWFVNVRNRWYSFIVKHRLNRCPGCHRIYRFSGDHSNCPLPF